jgi:hypothetical protein
MAGANRGEVWLVEHAAKTDACRGRQGGKPKDATMNADQFYCTEIREGPNFHGFFLYASTEGLTDAEYGYQVSSSWIADAYRSALEEVRKRLQANHDAANAGVRVDVSEPVEVSSDEVVKQNPRLHVYIEEAIKLARRELGYALHPIHMTWFWEAVQDVKRESLVQLRISDETGSFGVGFTPQELKDQSLVESRISRLYRDLLELGSQTRVMNLLRVSAGTAGE